MLDVVLERLAQFREKAAEIRGKVIGAMIYPAVLVVVAVAVDDAARAAEAGEHLRPGGRRLEPVRAAEAAPDEVARRDDRDQRRVDKGEDEEENTKEKTPIMYNRERGGGK